MTSKKNKKKQKIVPIDPFAHVPRLADQPLSNAKSRLRKQINMATPMSAEKDICIKMFAFLERHLFHDCVLECVLNDCKDIYDLKEVFSRLCLRPVQEACFARYPRQARKALNRLIGAANIIYDENATGSKRTQVGQAIAKVASSRTIKQSQTHSEMYQRSIEHKESVIQHTTSSVAVREEKEQLDETGKTISRTSTTTTTTRSEAEEKTRSQIMTEARTFANTVTTEAKESISIITNATPEQNIAKCHPIIARAVREAAKSIDDYLSKMKGSTLQNKRLRTFDTESIDVTNHALMTKVVGRIFKYHMKRMSKQMTVDNEDLDNLVGVEHYLAILGFLRWDQIMFLQIPNMLLQLEGNTLVVIQMYKNYVMHLPNANPLLLAEKEENWFPDLVDMHHSPSRYHATKKLQSVTFKFYFAYANPHRKTQGLEEFPSQQFLRFTEVSKEEHAEAIKAYRESDAYTNACRNTSEEHEKLKNNSGRAIAAQAKVNEMKRHIEYALKAGDGSEQKELLANSKEEMEHQLKELIKLNREKKEINEAYRDRVQLLLQSTENGLCKQRKWTLEPMVDAEITVPMQYFAYTQEEAHRDEVVFNEFHTALHPHPKTKETVCSGIAKIAAAFEKEYVPTMEHMFECFDKLSLANKKRATMLEDVMKLRLQILNSRGRGEATTLMQQELSNKEMILKGIKMPSGATGTNKEAFRSLGASFLSRK